MLLHVFLVDVNKTIIYVYEIVLEIRFKMVPRVIHIDRGNTSVLLVRRIFELKQPSAILHRA